MKNMLYVINGRFERNEFPLEGDTVLVGRSPENHIRLNDPSVSRAHLKIVRRGETFHIEDLNSRNGTWINGMPVKPGSEVPVTTGQHISLGNILVTIGRIFESEGLTSQYMIDLAGSEEETEGFLFLKDRRITDRGHLETIYEISTLLMRSLDLPTLLGRISGAVFSSLESIDTMALLLMDEESGELNQVASRSTYPEGDPRAECSLTIVHRTVEEGKAVIMADTKQEDEGDISASITFKRIKSVMCVPLVRKSRIMGAVYVHSVDRPFGFRKSDLYLLTAVCGAASVAIENALLFKRQQEAEAELRKARDELELRVQERTRELSVANTRLKEEIEERKRTEAALTESEEHIRDLFDNANDLIHSVSPEGRFLFVNRVWLETLGYSVEELEGLDIFDIIAPESLDHCRKAFERVISGESVTQLEAVFMTRQGRRISVEGNVGCRFEQGRPVSTRAIFRDVTERKAAEEARKVIEQRFRNLASAAKDAIISIDQEGRINYWNRAAEAMFGYGAEEVLGEDPHPLLTPERYRGEYGPAMKRWREHGKGPMLGRTRELTARRADGREFPVELSLSSGKVGETWNALGIVRDITERKEAEAVLQKRTRELDMRYKQVYCLYGISRLKGSPGTNLNAVLQGIVDLIPGALQYPDIACARLSLGHDVYRSPGFRETQWTLKRTIKANRESAGSLEIFYTEEKPDLDEGPFLVEERTLLHVIAEQVGEIIELKQAEEDLATAREREIDTAAKIQQTLLLGLPPRNLNGIRIAAMSVPSKRIDGDFYEFITLSNRVLDLIVGDVMGKGGPGRASRCRNQGPFPEGPERHAFAFEWCTAPRRYRPVRPQPHGRGAHRPGHLCDPGLCEVRSRCKPCGVRGLRPPQGPSRPRRHRGDDLAPGPQRPPGVPGDRDLQAGPGPF